MHTYDVLHPHAVDTVNSADRYDYNRNGSMVKRNKGTGEQTLRWDAANRLAQVSWGSPQQNEYYGYDEGGRRVAKLAVNAGGGSQTTFYPFAHYEQTVGASPGVTKYYFFNGQRVAVHNGVLRYLYQDALGSTIQATEQTGPTVGTLGYAPFGAINRSDGSIPTDYRFTGQQQDGTGLYYYGARFYDPNIGQFISPDTIVPDATNVMDYQRYAYARGNPLKFNDPSGHCSTLQNGEPDMENDGYCWGLAQAIAGFGRNLPDTFAAHWRITPDQWLTNIASQPFADSNYLQPFADQYYKEWGRQVGLPVDPVQWHEPDNLEFQFLGQGVAEAVIDDITSCQENPPWGCSNLADDASLVVAGGATLVCVAATGGGCLVVGGWTSTAFGFLGSSITTRNAFYGEATTADVIVSWTTTIVGGKYGGYAAGAVGTGVSIAQRIYDWWTGQQ